jgi:hypothetical protein
VFELLADQHLFSHDLSEDMDILQRLEEGQLPDDWRQLVRLGGGKKLAIFRSTKRSQRKWWFLSETDEEKPGKPIETLTAANGKTRPRRVDKERALLVRRALSCQHMTRWGL